MKVIHVELTTRTKLVAKYYGKLERYECYEASDYALTCATNSDWASSHELHTVKTNFCIN